MTEYNNDQLTKITSQTPMVTVQAMYTADPCNLGSSMTMQRTAFGLGRYLPRGPNHQLYCLSASDVDALNDIPATTRICIGITDVILTDIRMQWMKLIVLWLGSQALPITTSLLCAQT
jgi:hypothetical protein